MLVTMYMYMWEFQFVSENAWWGNDARTECVIQCYPAPWYLYLSCFCVCISCRTYLIILIHLVVDLGFPTWSRGQLPDRSTCFNKSVCYNLSLSLSRHLSDYLSYYKISNCHRGMGSFHLNSGCNLTTLPCQKYCNIDTHITQETNNYMKMSAVLMNM